MADHNWISLTEAEDLILDHRFKELGNYILSMKVAWQAIEDRLISGTLSARPKSQNGYECNFRGTHERPVFPLREDGTIPPEFWFHYREANKNAAGLTLTGVTNARRERDDLYFFQAEGFIEDGQMEGWAKGVTVARNGLGGLLPPQPGRRLGSFQYGHKDAKIVAAALDKIDRGEMSGTEAVRLFAPMMPGSPELESKKARLRSRLRELGISFQRKNHGT